MHTPLFVIQALAAVKDSGKTNMLDRDRVESEVFLDGQQRAYEWLTKASDAQYMDALNDMGAAESDDWMPEDNTDEETEV